MDDETTEGMLSIEAAAKYLDVSVNSVRRLCSSGELEHARYLGRIRFRRETLDSYVSEHTYEAA